MTRARAIIWVSTAVLIVAVARQIAYALTGGSLADRLSTAGGGPGPAWVAGVALAGSAASVLVGLWLVACGVRERCALELEGWVAAPPALNAGSIGRRTLVLSIAATAAFIAFESTLHYEEGLGFHGWHCIAGPVHQNAAPIIVGLSLTAAACITAAEYVLGALRRTVALRRLSRPASSSRTPTGRTPRDRAVPGSPRIGVSLGRGPPHPLGPSRPAHAGHP